jgi:hypothetical protein
MVLDCAHALHQPEAAPDPRKVEHDDPCAIEKYQPGSTEQEGATTSCRNREQLEDNEAADGQYKEGQRSEHLDESPVFIENSPQCQMLTNRGSS